MMLCSVLTLAPVLYPVVSSGITNTYKITNLSKTQYAKVSVSGTATTGTAVTSSAKSSVSVKKANGTVVTSTTKIYGTGKTFSLKVKSTNGWGKQYKLTVKVYNRSTNALVKTLTKTVTVWKKTHEIALNQSAASLEPGESTILEATTSPASYVRPITWTTSDASVATVENGTVTAVAEGTATITAKSGTESATTTITVEDSKPVVTSVSATGFNTLVIEGKNLSGLTTADIVISDNAATAVTISADGTTATVTLETSLEADVEKKVSVLGTEYTVKFAINASSVAIVKKTYDDNTSGQYVAFTVNGVQYAALDLMANGYTVTFEQWKEDGTPITDTTTLLSNANTGTLCNPITLGDYVVRVTLTKGSEKLVSEKETITIGNLDDLTSGIDWVGYTNTSSASSFTSNTTAAYSTVKVYQYDEVSTLVVGETLTLYEIDAVVDGKIVEDTSLSSTPYTLTSSNPSVISANGKVLTANSAGTAVITVKYGNYTKDYTYTVTNTKRSIASVVLSSTNQKVALSTSASSYVYVYDCYGNALDNVTVSAASSDSSVVTVSASGTTVQGTAKFTLTPADVGSTTVTYSYTAADGTTRIVLQTVTVTNAGGVNYKVELVDPYYTDLYDALFSNAGPASSFYDLSSDTTLDAYNDKFVEYAVNTYSNDGIYTGTLAYNTGYTVEVSQADTYVTSGQVGTGYDNVHFAASGLKGTTTVSFYLNNDAKTLLGQVVINTVNTAPQLSGFTFNTMSSATATGSALNITDYLKLSGGNTDKIVEGYTLTNSSTAKVRYYSANRLLYLDLDGSATYTSADLVLGYVRMVALSDCTSSLSGKLGTGVQSNITIAGGDKGTVAIQITQAGAGGVEVTSNPVVLFSTYTSVDVK